MSCCCCCSSSSWDEVWDKNYCTNSVWKPFIHPEGFWIESVLVFLSKKTLENVFYFKPVLLRGGLIKPRLCGEREINFNFQLFYFAIFIRRFFSGFFANNNKPSPCVPQTSHLPSTTSRKGQVTFFSGNSKERKKHFQKKKEKRKMLITFTKAPLLLLSNLAFHLLTCPSLLCVVWLALLLYLLLLLRRRRPPPYAARRRRPPPPPSRLLHQGESRLWDLPLGAAATHQYPPTPPLSLSLKPRILLSAIGRTFQVDFFSLSNYLCIRKL